jgi:hypothetical protein
MELTAPQPPRAVFRELGSVVTVEPKWSLEGVFPSRAVFKVATPSRNTLRMGWSWDYVVTVGSRRANILRR